MPDKTETIHCRYTLLDNGIHEYVLADSSRAAFDEFLEHSERVSQETNPQEIVLNLIDFRQSGLPPMKYGFQRSQEAVARAKKEGRSIPPTRNACLYNPGMLITLVQTFVNLLNVNAVGQFFSADERDKAIAWLLEGRASAET